MEPHHTSPHCHLGFYVPRNQLIPQPNIIAADDWFIIFACFDLTADKNPTFFSWLWHLEPLAKTTTKNKLLGIQEVQKTQSYEWDLKVLKPSQSKRDRWMIITRLQLEKQLLDPSHHSEGGRKVQKCWRGRKGGPVTDPGGRLAFRAYIERWHAPPPCDEALCYNCSSIKSLTDLRTKVFFCVSYFNLKICSF